MVFYRLVFFATATFFHINRVEFLRSGRHNVPWFLPTLRMPEKKTSRDHKQNHIGQREYMLSRFFHF